MDEDTLLTVPKMMVAAVVGLTGAIGILWNDLRIKNQKVQDRLDECEKDRLALHEHVSDLARKINSLSLPPR